MRAELQTVLGVLCEQDAPTLSTLDMQSQPVLLVHGDHRSQTVILLP